MAVAILDRPDVQALLGREIARRCLGDFCARMDPSYERARHADLLIEHLEAVERGDIKRLAVFMPPRHSKTYHVSERFPAWFLGRNPTRRVILASYGADLAEGSSRKVRNLLLDQRWPWPGVRVAQDSAAVNKWATNQGGEVIAAGVGGAMTGFGADLLVIDDPVKGRAEADSETYRETTWNWYTEVARTRLMPGGRIVLCQCMTGDTRVTMANGTEKALRDVRAGDVVASYDHGRIVASKVLRWENQGPDYVFAIRMKSGTIARANERHPFLVDRGGVLEWVRLKDLRAGDIILRATGGNGAASSVPSTGARRRRSAGAIAPRTTTRPDGQVVSGHLRSTPPIAGMPTSSTDTVSALTSTTHCSPSKVGAVPYAARSQARTSALIGAGSSAWTIVTLAAGSEGCFATTATSWSATGSRSESCSKPLDTFEIIPDTIVAIKPDGREDVFDIQVEGTENFIANGLVSHNTRWHEDDLAGRILNRAGWTVLNLPALATDNDPLGRALGEPLWPEWFGVQELAELKADLTSEQGARGWLALYQQRPTADEGGMFKRGWFKARYEDAPSCDLRVLGVDSAFKAGVHNDESALVLVGVTDTAFPVLDVVAGRWEYPELKRRIIDAARLHQPHAIAIEDTASGQSVIQELRASTLLPIVPIKVSASKEARAAAVAPTCESGRVLLPNVSTWGGGFLDQLAAFPTGAHDDMVDAFVHALGYATLLAAQPRQMSSYDVRMGGGRQAEPEARFQRMRLPEPARAR